MNSLKRFFLKLVPAPILTRRTLPIVLILIVGTVLSIEAFRLVHSLETQERIKIFEQIAIAQFEHLDSSLEEAVVDKVYAIRSFFLASNKVTRKEFKVFVSNLDRHGSSFQAFDATIQAFEWIPRVPESSRESYEKAAVAGGHPGFRFTERENQGRMIPAGRRAEYFPVYYVEPLQGNEAAFGFDLGSNPTRLEALRKARDTGALVATERITLVQEDQDQFGFLVFLPVYASGEVPTTVAMRRKKLTGLVLGVYRVAGIVRSSLPEQNPSEHAVEIYIYDLSAPPGRQLLYPKNASAQSVEALTNPFQMTKIIRVADREWKVVIAPAGGTLARDIIWEPWAALAGILLLTTLLSFYLFNSNLQKLRLIQSETKYRDVFEGSVQGIMVHRNYKPLLVNEAYAANLGYDSSAELMELNTLDLIDPQDRDRLSKFNAARQMGTHAPSHYEYRGLRKDGSAVWVMAHTTTVNWEGEPATMVTSFDISARKQMEEEITTVRDDLVTLIDTANAPIFGIDTLGLVNEWNQTAERITGFSREEVMGHDLVAEFISEEHRGSVKAVFDRALQGEQTENYEFPLFSKEGRRVDVLLNSTTRRDAKGNIVGVVGIGQDITERKQAEQHLLESEQRFRDFAESAADWFWEMDEDLKFIYMSPNVERILGVKPEWHYGKTRADLLGDDYDKEVWKTHLEDLQAHRPFRDFTYLRVGEDVWPRWLTTSGIPIFDGEGRFKGYRGTANDITARVQIDAELKQLVGAVEKLDECVVLFDQDDRFVFCNESYRKLNAEIVESTEKGTLFEDHLRAGIRAGLIVDGIGREDKWIAERLERHRNPAGPFEVSRQNGKTILINEQKLPDGGMALVISDITTIKQVQAQVIQASKLATLGEMATGVAHELNQPLNVISMAAGNLMRRQKKGTITPEYMEEKLLRITSQTERAAAIIDHMRMFGRKSSEKPVPLHLRDSIFRAIDLMGEQLRLLGIHIETELPESCPPVLGHQVQIEQVLLNLLANARDAIKAQPVDHPKKISIGGDMLDDGRIAISIQDTGGGIPELVLDRVFEPFFTTKEVGKGTGLGLSVSYGIIQDMGGTIEAKNTGEGARFTITLPVHSQESSKS